MKDLTPPKVKTLLGVLIKAHFKPVSIPERGKIKRRLSGRYYAQYQPLIPSLISAIAVSKVVFSTVIGFSK